MNNSYITIIKEKRTALSRKRIPLNQNGCTANFRIGVPFEQNLHGKKDKYEEAIDLAIENKIELGYTNYCFDLWLILHKEDYFDIVQNQDAYADKLRQVFGLAADANIKKEKRVTEIVNQIGLSDIKNAIQRGKKISEDNQGKEANKTPKENRYYDNPDTQMHVLLQFLFAKVGINIDALG